MKKQPRIEKERSVCVCFICEGTRGLEADRFLTVRIKVTRTFWTILGPLHFLLLKRIQYRVVPNSYLVRPHKYTMPGSARKVSLPFY